MKNVYLWAIYITFIYCPNNFDTNIIQNSLEINSKDVFLKHSLYCRIREENLLFIHHGCFRNLLLNVLKTIKHNLKTVKIFHLGIKYYFSTITSVILTKTRSHWPRYTVHPVNVLHTWSGRRRGKRKVEEENKTFVFIQLRAGGYELCMGAIFVVQTFAIFYQFQLYLRTN